MTTPTAGQPLLDVAGLRVTYGGVVAVADVDLRIGEGTISGLIGPNGAGKTSMVDALTGYTRPAAGWITFGGRDISGLRPYRRARLGVARTFQSVELFDDLTVEENLLVASEHVTVASALRDLFLPQRPPDRTGVDWAISVCGLEDVTDRYPGEFSGASASGRAPAGRWPASPGWSCWTSPRRASTPTRAWSWGAG